MLSLPVERIGQRGSATRALGRAGSRGASVDLDGRFSHRRRRCLHSIHTIPHQLPSNAPKPASAFFHPCFWPKAINFRGRGAKPPAARQGRPTDAESSVPPPAGICPVSAIRLEASGLGLHASRFTFHAPSFCPSDTFRPITSPAHPASLAGSFRSLPCTGVGLDRSRSVHLSIRAGADMRLLPGSWPTRPHDLVRCGRPIKQRPEAI